jgi:hypothetical protein
MKRWVKILAIAYVAFEFFTPSLGFVRASAQGGQVGVLNFGTSPLPIPFIVGPVDPGNGQANLNSVILEIDNVLGVSFPQVPGGVNSPTIGESTTGTPVVLGAQGADTNVGISIQPKAAGNITLFSQANSGVLQYGNQSSFVAGNGVDRCPGAAGVARSLGAGIGIVQAGGATGGVVKGFFINADWMGRQYAVPACG